jgi:hypothetical protein
MGLEDYIEAPVALAVAATTVVLSPRVRGAMRKGAVYGVAGAMKAADAVTSAARDMAGEARGTGGEEGTTAAPAMPGDQPTQPPSA